jgi:hypothetical protein
MDSGGERTLTLAGATKLFQHNDEASLDPGRKYLEMHSVYIVNNTDVPVPLYEEQDEPLRRFQRPVLRTHG